MASDTTPSPSNEASNTTPSPSNEEKSFSDSTGLEDVSSESSSPDRMQQARSSRITNEQNTRVFLQLHKAALEGNWEAAKHIFDNNPSTINIWADEVTPILHVAVGVGKKTINFVQKLVAMMSDDGLALQDDLGWTALGVAAAVGNRAAASILVDRMPSLLYVGDNYGDFPIHVAALYGHRDVLEYFMSVTEDDVEANPYADSLGLRLLKRVIKAEFLDIALYLARKYPSLATLKLHNKTTALESITTQMSMLKNRRQLKFYKCFIDFLPWITKTTRANEQAIELVKCLCKQLESRASSQTQEVCDDAILRAAELGVHEVVEAIVETFPTAVYIYSSPAGQHIFHIAVINRHENVFNLIYQMSDHKHLYTDIRDSEGNNLLHLAGKLAPPNKLNEISGAALQMQRELQWFKEVEKFVHPSSRQKANDDGETPKMLFSEEHKELKKAREKWMKDTASSYTIAATLIGTVMFAAAITVPGGNASNTGFPIFSKEKAFTEFAYADAISLFTSATSLLMFLSILTSRYAEEDFLRALPKRLIIGLSTLFISITCMMFSFAAAVFLVFGQKRAWVRNLVAALASLPISSFVLLQFPLLVDLISCTYGPGIFGKQTNRPFY